MGWSGLCSRTALRTARIACLVVAAAACNAGATPAAALDSGFFRNFADASIPADVAHEASGPAADAPERADAFQCTPAAAEIPLFLLGDEGRVMRMHIGVRSDAQDRSLLVDTGVGTSFVALGVGQPDFVRNAATFEMGCYQFVLPGRGLLAPENPSAAPERSCIGYMGIDFFIDVAGIFDFERGVMSFSTEPVDPTGAEIIPLELVGSGWVANATIDGRAVRLIVDTGAAHSLLLGEEGRPDDVPFPTRDVEGNPLVFFRGMSDLTVNGAMHRVPVLRAESFPILEARLRSKGVALDGLLGMTSLSGRKLIIDGPGQRLLVWRS